MNNKHVQSIEQSMNKIRNNNLSVQKSKFPSISIPNIRRPPSKYLILILLAILGGIILCILMIPKYGIVGASIASSISYFLYSAIMIYKFLNTTKITFLKLIFPTKSDFQNLKKKL